MELELEEKMLIELLALTNTDGNEKTPFRVFTTQDGSIFILPSNTLYRKYFDMLNTYHLLNLTLAQEDDLVKEVIDAAINARNELRSLPAGVVYHAFFKEGKLYKTEIGRDSRDYPNMLLNIQSALSEPDMVIDLNRPSSNKAKLAKVTAPAYVISEHVAYLELVHGIKDLDAILVTEHSDKFKVVLSDRTNLVASYYLDSLGNVLGTELPHEKRLPFRDIYSFYYKAIRVKNLEQLY